MLAMIEALRKVIKRMHYPLDVMLVCVRWHAAYPLGVERTWAFKPRAAPASSLAVDHRAPQRAPLRRNARREATSAFAGALPCGVRDLVDGPFRTRA